MKADEQILILGHRGLLGGALVSLCPDFCRVEAGGRAAFDLSLGAKAGAQARELITRHQPDVVINCAAFTHVDQAESDPVLAREVNTLGVEQLAKACAGAGAHLIHLSTDYVFDGRGDRPYREDDPPNPLSVYAESKLEGEARILAALPTALVARTAWLFGKGRENFVSWLLAKARRGEPVPVVTDQTGSPTYNLDLAKALLELARSRVGGILHLVNQGPATRRELAEAALELAGLDKGLIRPVKSKELGLAATRPAYTVLDTGRYEGLARRAMPHWRDALGRHLAEEDI